MSVQDVRDVSSIIKSHNIFFSGLFQKNVFDICSGLHFHPAYIDRCKWTVGNDGILCNATRRGYKRTVVGDQQQHHPFSSAAKE